MTRQPGATWARHLRFTAMTPDAARIIADTWKYPAPYEFYDATADAEDYEEFVTPAQWPDKFWQVRHGEELVGFFSAQATDDDACEISLGLRPDLTGAGRGLAFLRAGLDHLDGQGRCPRVTLSVAGFNQRAIKVYQAAGFTIVRTYPQSTNGGIYDFVAMELRRTR